MTVRMAWVSLVCVALLAARPLAAANADVTLQNGVYQGIVLGVHPDTPQPDDSVTFKQKIQSFLEAGSDALSTALDGDVAFGDVKLVLPRSWNKTNFGVVVNPAEEELTIASADILLHDAADSLPSTLQAEQCGVPGRQIEIPLSFLSLSAEEETRHGKPGAILAHEWAHYRYGVHDEHGYTNDPVYPPAYGPDNTPSACTVGALEGTWKTTCSGNSSCRPNNDGCYYCVSDDATPSTVQASLGYMPALSTGHFCNAETHNRHSPSPQNLLCGRRSVMEVIQAHPDYQNMNLLSNMTAGTININLYEEPLGRVLLLLDTPPESGEVLSYTELLSNLEVPLTKYSSLELAVASYKHLAEGVTVTMLRDFAPIAGDYGSLSTLLPQQEPRSVVPDLALVVSKLLEDIGLYSPGTLVVMPVSNELMGASKLDGGLGSVLRRQRVKPLLLFPETSPSLAGAASFLQHSGARFIARNYTTSTEGSITEGPLDYASMAAFNELHAFVDNTYQNDHAFVTVDVDQVQGESSFTSENWYQGSTAEHQLAVLTTSGDIGQLKLIYNHHGVYRDCTEKNVDFCTVTEDAIFFHKWNTKPYNFGGTWHLRVSNTGFDPVTVTLTRSIVNYVRETEQELSVDVWSSDSHGPVAALSNNAVFVLYASVSNRGKQVLGSNIHVMVDVDVERPGAALEHIVGLKLLDNGTSPDIRANDSVFSGHLADEPFEEGTVVTVKSVTVASHTIQGELTPSSTRQHRHHASAASARLFSRDPEDEECCGSFVENPDILLSHSTMGFYLHLPEPIKPITVARTPTATTTTITTTTPAPTTTAAPEKTTTVLPPASTTVPPASTTVPPATTTVKPATTTTLAPTTTAGVAPLETSVKVLLQTAVVLCFATLMR